MAGDGMSTNDPDRPEDDERDAADAEIARETADEDASSEAEPVSANASDLNDADVEDDGSETDERTASKEDAVGDAEREDDLEDEDDETDLEEHDADDAGVDEDDLEEDELEEDDLDEDDFDSEHAEIDDDVVGEAELEDEAEPAEADGEAEPVGAELEDDVEPAQADDAAEPVEAAAAEDAQTVEAPALEKDAAGFWAAQFAKGELGWERDNLNPAFEAWRAANAIVPPLKIIVPGCGRAPEVAELAAEPKIDVIAVDIADAAVDWQRSTLKKAGLQAQVEKADILSWKPKGSVGAVYDQTCLCALPPETWPTYERQVHGWLRRQGKLFVLFMQTGRDASQGPPFDCPLERMRELFSEERWRWDDPPYVPSPHPMGHLTEIGVALTRR